VIIAIDGPAASGKGTIARRLARELGFAYLDTGALYRAVALRLLRSSAAPDGANAAHAAAAVRPAADLADPALRDEAVAGLASRLGAMAEVRAALLAFQRDFASRPPAGAAGAVLDGRDIGTVVCPDADIKLFVTASLEERVRRRVSELAAEGRPAEAATIRADLEARDARDRARSVAPLRQADDAYLLDTTNLDIDSAFAAAKALVSRHRT